ncbi:MAG TPA: hypothetical protein VFF67_03675 [Thermoplasmata archaeon]|nr:hypothetical protein [Thermoplasmata archaeon]
MSARRASPARSFVLAALLTVVPAFALGLGTVGAAPVAPMAAAPAATGHVAASHPGASVFNPACYKVTGSICISIAYVGEPNIIPNPGSKVSSVEPNASQSLSLWIKSRVPLNWTNNPRNGTNCPVTLNVTGTLWNGDPYMSTADSTTYHGNSASNYYFGPQLTANTSGYIWWYNVTISAKSPANNPNFYPGETVTWWIAFTFNNSNVFSHLESPHFQYRLAGAWPFSPYPGSVQFAGGSATFEDVSLTANPPAPNWNDSVGLVLNTTQADVIQAATLGSAYADITVTSPAGTLLSQGTIFFNASVNSAGFGVVNASATIPAADAQVAGATVTFQVWAFDAANDQIVTPLFNYTVGGNGSFISGTFTDDLGVQSNPAAVAVSVAGTTVVNPGQPVVVTLTSRNPGSAISAAEITASIGLPLLRESVPIQVPFHRVSSTIFTAKLPGLPLGSFVNFTMSAWDFSQRLELSPSFGYVTPDLPTLVPVIPGNASFMYVLVYDNGTHSWVNDALVQFQEFIQGHAAGVNSVGNSTFGLAYPNETLGAFTPLLLPANATFHVTVTDPGFAPPTGQAGAPVTTTIVTQHVMSSRQTLAANATYQIVQEGNVLFFYLNSTPPAPPSSPPVTHDGSVPIAAIVGPIAALFFAIPLLLWFRRIRERRQAEEKRITL